MKVSFEIADGSRLSVLEFCRHFSFFNPRKMTITEVAKMAAAMGFTKPNPLFTAEQLELLKKNPGMYEGKVAFEVEDRESMQACFEATQPVFQQLESQLNK